MKRISYKNIAMMILLISIFMLAILKYVNLEDYIKTIFIAIFVNLISAVIIIYLIDVKKEDDIHKELVKKRKIVYRQLINPLKGFDSFILHMYKAAVTYDEMERLNYNIENIDEIIEKIKLIDNNKNSYIGNSDFSSQTWKESILKQLLKFSEDITRFNDINSYILPNSLSENIDNILLLNSNKHVIYTVLKFDASIKTEDIIEIFNFKQLLTSSFKIKEEILKYYDRNLFEIDKKELLREDILPRFGSGLEDKNLKL